MSNIPVAALGVAVGLLGPAVITLSSIRANRPDVFGSAHVNQSSPPPATGFTGRADLHLVVNAQGIRNAVVRIRDARVPVSKWPDIGSNLPVLIPNGNPRRLQILWDQVRAHHDLAMDDVSYSPYVEEEYVDEGASYPEYSPTTDPTAETVVDEPPARVVPQRSRSEWARPDQEHRTETTPTDEIPVVTPPAPVTPEAPASPAPASPAPASPASGTAPGTEAVATAAPARRRPSPRPRPRTAPPDSVEAVVPMPTPASETVVPVVPPVVPPADEPRKTRSEVVEAKSAVPASVERMDPVVPAGGLFVGSVEQDAPAGAAAPADRPEPAAPAEAPEPAAPAEAPEPAAPSEAPAATAVPSDTEPATPARGAPEAEVPAETEAEDTATESGTAGPNTVEFTLAPIPLPRRVPGSSGHRPADDEPDAAGPVQPEPAGRAGTNRPKAPPYLASYLADEPEDAKQRLGGVHNVSVTVIVSDLRRSLAFYRDVLNLTQIDGGMGSAILVGGNARILLRQVADTRPVDRRVLHVNLEVDDVHEHYERLSREGVEFIHPPRVISQGEQLEQWAAMLRDPDGHAVNLTRWEIRS
ncbi:VOC family protein [Planosporangium mesophilum]|nr:VOC family protein [Planosporangium mesophilum]NJC84188.1 VOC family protein [Planosporangium mesophilum]